MNKMRLAALIGVLCAGPSPGVVNAQSLDVIGTRAAGMGGAFVGVADDASAVYWNPAGLAAGAYFSLVLDGGVRRAAPDEGPRGEKHSSFLLAATMPALGLSYYRLRAAVASADSPAMSAPTGTPSVRVDTLVTNHAGVTFVQSLVPSVAIGSTVKLVRGIAASGLTESAGAAEALDSAEPRGDGATRVDLDLGIMAAGRRVKAGLTLRNVREPEFTTPEGRTLKLERQARAGVSYALTSGILLAADADLLTSADGFGERRDAAFGIEGRLARRAWVRSGLRFNTAGNSDGQPDGTGRAFTAGGSYAATASVTIDAVVISGGDRAGRGWGISARFVY